MTTINGQPVPPLDYETLRQLERIAFGLTSSTMPDVTAHRVALDAATAALETMRRIIQARRA